MSKFRTYLGRPCNVASSKIGGVVTNTYEWLDTGTVERRVTRGDFRKGNLRTLSHEILSGPVDGGGRYVDSARG